LGDVSLTGQPDHNVQLLQLDVDGVVVLDKEHLHLVLENVGPLLDDEVDVTQGYVLDLQQDSNGAADFDPIVTFGTYTTPRHGFNKTIGSRYPFRDKFADTVYALL
jgi:hypothetical protein